MRYWMMAVLAAAALVAALRAEEQEQQTKEKSPADQYQALLDEYLQLGRPEEFAGKFLELAKKHPKEPAALEALVWVVTNVRSGQEPSQAVELLAKDHMASEKLGLVCQQLAASRTPSLAAEKLLRVVLEKSPRKEVQAQACFSLAMLLRQQSSLLEIVKSEPELARRVEQFFGTQFSQHLASLDEKKLSAEIEKLFQQIVDSYADVEPFGKARAEFAERQLFELRFLSIGKVAPEIEGEDIDGALFKLSDYRGKVVMLDFWGHW